MNLIALAPWSGVVALWLVIRYLTRRDERKPSRIEALADLTREPRPAPRLPDADRPGTTASILLADETETLAAAAVQLAVQPAHPGAAAEGYRIADFLRTRIPAASDAEIGRAVIAMLWVTKSVADRSDDLVTAYGVLVESLARAALHLTQLDRTDAP